MNWGTNKYTESSEDLSLLGVASRELIFSSSQEGCGAPVLLDNISGQCQAGREGLLSEEKVPYGGANAAHGAFWVILVLTRGSGLGGIAAAGLRSALSL